MDGWTAGQTVAWTSEQADRQSDGRTYQRTDGPTDRRTRRADKANNQVFERHIDLPKSSCNFLNVLKLISFTWQLDHFINDTIFRPYYFITLKNVQFSLKGKRLHDSSNVKKMQRK